MTTPNILIVLWKKTSKDYLLFIPGLTATLPTTSSSELDLNSNFLPESFPEGIDPSQYALPVFLEEPKDTYAARGASATLNCKAAHALKAYFTCNDEKKASSSEEDLQDPKTGMKFKKVTIEVTRSDVMDVLGRFSCKCHASSAKGEVSSSEAVVKQACKSKKYLTLEELVHLAILKNLV